ncbi:hypothetical protein CRE_08851 [Caenorhabditis remanei]|uniref:Uncharacterized protein n=1 Tax=Caenorhabditis remanei TaxID=31234 RepID=E3LHV8_CAERE|nr:hypothetical protein CRE_08851 [Caenorhabditis remanei]
MHTSMRNEGDPSIERLAPVSIKGSQKINKVFHELIDSWKQYTSMEDGDRIAQLLQNYSVEKQLEHVGGMSKEEILDVFRAHLRKLTSVQEENEHLTRRNRDISEKLHRIEHRVGKAQANVFDKVQEATMEILKDFHAREIELARKVEVFEAEKTSLTAKNTKLEGKVEEFSQKNSTLQAKNQRLIEINNENEKRIGGLTQKNQTQDDEIFHLREQLEKANELAREKTEEALQEAIEAQRVKTLIIKEREAVNLQAARHQEILMAEMDKYKADLEEDLSVRYLRHKKEVEALNAKYDSAMAHSEQTIHDLKLTNRQLEAKISKFERNFAMMEAQIKGNMKRSLAMNYQEMLNIISSGTSRLPSPPRENPFLELEKENSSRKHRLAVSKTNPRRSNFQCLDFWPTSSESSATGKAKNVVEILIFSEFWKTSIDIF